MPKGRKRTTRRRTTRKRSSRKLNYQQRSATSYVKKKYTVIYPAEMDLNLVNYEQTISLFGGKNVAVPASTTTLIDCDPDGILTADLKAYQFLRITGVAVKLIFPLGTTVSNTCVQHSTCYSRSTIIRPTLSFGQAQALQSFQTGGCNRTWSRYYPTAVAQRAAGVSWIDTAEIPKMANNPPVALYDGQLQPDSGASLHIRLYRASQTPGLNVPA